MVNWHEKMISMLQYMSGKGASDLHLTVGSVPHIRVNGKIVQSELPPVSKEELENLLYSLLNEDEKKAYLETKTLDFSFGEHELGRFRVNIYQQRGTISAAIRLLPLEIIGIDYLGIPAEPLKKFCSLPHGLVLVCGPVGSGKTTTLASMIDYINKTRNCHVISIEDPIEYIHKNNKALIHQREVKQDTPNFIDALKFILREDPDIVVIGEMRDTETMTSALTIAETGHLVFATLHTGDASESIRRMVDSFPATHQTQISTQISYVLRGVINQMLLPKKDGQGRVMASEIMIVTPAIQNIIRENKVEQIHSHIQMGTGLGMQTMSQSLSDLVKGGKISPEFAMTKTKRDKELGRLLGQENYA
ncbi:MAG: type IV pilus twitching motility protein PilT [Endomicrobiales bacterium]|nr:type IV pilus twitching motility protein PilT [Endomicrobiales bacterium]